MPRKESIILPFSHCSDCGKSLPFWLNIPIFSYIILRGKCKYCGSKIHIHHLFVEIITPLVLIVLFLKFGTDLVLFTKYSVFFCLLIPIFFIDLFHRLILDKLTIPMAILGIGFALLPQTDVTFLNALITSLAILVLMLVISWLFEKIRHKEGMGGGDIKLLAAMATYLGAISISFIIFFSSVLAVIVALSTAKTREQGLPFGPFLAVTSLLWILAGKYFLSWYLGLF